MLRPLVLLFLFCSILCAAPGDYIWEQQPTHGAMVPRAVTPAAGKLLGWPTSVNTPAAITIGAGLTLTGSTLSASGGSGLGSVTSVAVTGTDGIQIDSGSPVTTAGTIVLGIDASALKTHLSLASVENTALSTWAGTVNLTTLGTITTGTWHGAVIGATYGGAGTISGILKANGSGTVSAAVAGTDYLTPTGNGSGLTGITASQISGLSSNATHTGDATGATALTVVGINGTLLSSLGTGILKNTTGTGVPSIAVAGDFPTLNQSTSGNAASATALATPRAINGVNFDGTAAITVTAAANTLSGSTLASGVTASSLTSAAGGSFGTAAFTNTNAYEVPLTFSTGLTRTVNTVTVNTSQNITKLTGLTSNGFVKTSGGDGSLSVDTSTYLTSITGTTNEITVTGSTISLPSALTFTGKTITGGTFVFPDDIKQIFNPGATYAGFNTGSVASDPSTLGNGDMWYDSTLNKLYAYINGGKVSLGEMGGGGTVTSVSVTTANGISGSVANATSTPAITLTLGAITPSSVNGVVLSGSATPTLAVTGTATVSGSNTGDQDLSGYLTSSTAASTYQPKDADLTIYAGITPSANVQTLLGSADYAAFRTSLGLGTLATQSGTFSGTSSGTNTGDNAVNSLYSGLVSNATHTGDATGATALTVVGINGTILSGLGTGILKNTTGTGVPSIATAGDFPTLNQSTTGSAATLTTSRSIYGNNFNGSADLTQVIASTYGGTGNGFIKFTGTTTTEKVKTVRDANDTVLELGGSYTPTGTWTGMILSAPQVSVSGALGTDDTYSGTTISGLTAGATIAQWETVYLGSSSTWLLADANGSGTYPARGLAVAAYSSTNAAVVIVHGTVRNDAWSWTPGGTIYLSTTAGGLTQTAPSTSGDKVQQVGFALTADIIFVDFSSGETVTVQ